MTDATMHVPGAVQPPVQRPPGFPLPLLDRIDAVEPGVRARGRKLVAVNEPYFAGHFPGTPVLPGVLVCEALAQLAGVAAGGEGTVRLAGVRRARFRRPVTPGDVVVLEASVEAHGAEWHVRGTARVEDALVAEVDLVCGRVAATRIHPTAIVSPTAELGPGVEVGPYAVVGPHVRIGADGWIGTHAVVSGRTSIGARVRVFPMASIGLEPQDRKYQGEPSTLEIGDDCTFREFCSVNPGTAGGGMRTTIGSACLFMVSSHVGHDCRVGSFVILANSAALAGHCEVGDYAIVGGLAGVHQFVRVGESALCAAGAMVSMDVPPYCLVAGDRARLFGLNVVGLERRGLEPGTIRALKRAYVRLFRQAAVRREAVEEVRARFASVAEVRRLCDFVASSPRGVCR